MDDLNFAKIEKKWQDRWEKEKVFEAKELGAGGRDGQKEKFYVLEMFPYPSGTGLHMGHALNYTIGDVLARFKRMKGFDVLYPMGFDSLGLPAENAAIKAGEHPADYTRRAIANYIRQMKALGLSYDWSKMISSMEPEYYRWNQLFFLKFLEKGLAYKKKSPVNWCSECNSVLANEQVHDGKCWRHGNVDVETKHLEQWFLKTTEYADELLDCIDELEWPEKIKTMQKNWIGRSEGVEIEFEVLGERENIGTDCADRHGFEIGKVILVDAVHCLVDEEGNVNEELKSYLDSLPNRKIVLTSAPVEKHELFFRNIKDYEIFTLEFNPGKDNPEYYRKVLKKFGLKAEDVVYFEHGEDAMGSAVSVDIDTFFYEGDVDAVKEFIDSKIEPRKGAEGRGDGGVWKVFTTRPDTIFGVTFMVVAAGHEKLDELVTAGQRKAVDEFLKKIKSVSEKDISKLDKEGVFSGSYAINPANGERVPIWIGNFVLADYGSGMVMGVPAHDKRDFAFAKKYGIEVRQVVDGEKLATDFTDKHRLDEAYVGEGVLVNSCASGDAAQEGQFDGMDNVEAKGKITDWLGEKGVARRVVNFKLRDWGISRQRYWGTPIPIIYCETCGAMPVPEKDLPVELPYDVEFGKGNPLETNEDFVNAKCPKCGRDAKRETDTMDTFVDSSWYYMRYPDPHNSEVPFDSEIVKYWLPCDQYIGGIEHATMHLLYARFWTKALRDLGFVDCSEPFTRLFSQGMLHGPDGDKMSKSKGNVINPDEVSKKYGMDTARYFLLSLAAPDKSRDWSEKGIMGSSRFIKKIVRFFDGFDDFGDDSAEVLSKLNESVRDVSQYYDSFDYRKATICLKELFDLLVVQKKVSRNTLETSLKLLSPICPHICEELWEKIEGEGFLSLSSWPELDLDKILKAGRDSIDLNERIVERIRKIVKDDTKKVYVYVMPFEVEKVDAEKIKQGISDFGFGIREVEVFAVNDSGKVDPKGMAKKAKPGMAGIYLE